MASCSGQLHALVFWGSFVRGSSRSHPLLLMTHLNLSDVALDSHTNPSMARLLIKQSKTDPFVEIFLGRSGAEVCPVQALIQYIGVCPPTPGPLFILSTGAPLTRAHLVSCLQSVLRQSGLDDSAYNGHSFRIGAATTAAQQGLEDSLIQTLGRWRSDAYKLYYIKLPRAQLVNVSQALARGTTKLPFGIAQTWQQRYW